MSESAPRSLPIRITSKADGTPSVILAGQELVNVLSYDGVQIEFVDEYPLIPSKLGSLPRGQSVPKVVLTFAPGALELDFDVDLLERLLSEARDD